MTTTIIFNDAWDDGGGLDATDVAWYGTTGSNALDQDSYTRTNNVLSARSGANARGFHGVFARQSIANTGDKITVTFTFLTPPTVGNKMSGLRVGFFDSNGSTASVGGAPIHTQSSPSSTDSGWNKVYGEAVDLDVYENDFSNFAFKSKTESVTTNRLLNSFTDWTFQGAGIGDGAYNIVAGTEYTGTFSIENMGNNLYDLSATISYGGSFATFRSRGKTIAVNAFDIIAFGHSNGAFGSNSNPANTDNGLDYINIQVAFTQANSGSAGDPYIWPIKSNIPVKLPNTTAIYRMFEHGNNYVNALVDRAGEEHSNRMLEFTKSRNLSTRNLIVDGYFYKKFFISSDNNDAVVDLVNKKVDFNSKAAKNYFTISQKKALFQCGGFNEKCLKMVMSWKDSSGKKYETEVMFFNNPHVENGINVIPPTLNGCIGMLVDNYKPKLMRVPSLYTKYNKKLVKRSKLNKKHNVDIKKGERWVFTKN